MLGRWLAISAVLIGAGCAETGESRSLTFDVLTRGEASVLPVPLAEFTAVAVAEAPTQSFVGRLHFDGAGQDNHLTVIRDSLGLVKTGRESIRELPPFDIEFVTDGDFLIPMEQGPLITGHPWWDLVLRPGRIWGEPGDEGFSRASIPFALKERGEDCTHNGLMMFLFRESGEMSHIAFQISNQTCLYLQFELSGTVSAEFVPGPVSHGEEIAAIVAQNRATRLPVHPITSLAAHYPGSNPAKMGSTEEIDPADMTAYGFVIDGKHFASDCMTPAGPYPYCDDMALPSYSTAKSLVAGLGLMLMEHDYPGTADARITEYVPECGDSWDGVTIEHALDMTTGHFSQSSMHGDEDLALGSDFFLSQTHEGKIHYACTAHPRKAEPGQHLAYHSWDTYLAGTAMNARLRSIANPEADFYRDLLVEKIWRPLGLSLLSQETRRTYDEIAQPFSGYGVTFVRDDVARLLQFLGPKDGQINGGELLDRELFGAVKGPTPEDPGMAAELDTIRYNNGFRSFDVSSYLGCERPAWVVTLSGFGGINFVVMPNDTAYYYFSDGNAHRYLDAVRESHAIRPMCSSPSAESVQ